MAFCRRSCGVLLIKLIGFAEDFDSTCHSTTTTVSKSPTSAAESTVGRPGQVNHRLPLSHHRHLNHSYRQPADFRVHGSRMHHGSLALGDPGFSEVLCFFQVFGYGKTLRAWCMLPVWATWMSQQISWSRWIGSSSSVTTSCV